MKDIASKKKPKQNQPSESWQKQEIHINAT